MAEATGSGEAPAPGPSGLGGWLSLLCAVIVLSMVGSCISLWTSYEQLSPVWPAFSTGQAGFLLVITAVDIVAGVVVPAALIVLFLRKSQTFPGVFIIWAVASPLLTIIETFFYDWVFDAFRAPGDEILDAETKKDIVRSVFWACVGIAYIYRSDRVSTTFVN